MTTATSTDTVNAIPSKRSQTGGACCFALASYYVQNFSSLTRHDKLQSIISESRLHPHSVGSSSLASSILQCSACSLLARYDIAQKLLLVATSMVILAEQLIPKFIQCLNHRSSSYQRQKPSQAASIISSDDPQMSIEMVNARGIDRMAVLGLDACTIV